MSGTSGLKQRAKDMLGAASLRLPWGARRALLDSLVRDFGIHREVARLARQSNIAGFLADGEWGLFQSAMSDEMILPIYARTGTWARRANQELMEFFAGGGGTYLDIGANIGLTTVPVARNDRVTCVAFEPDPTNYRNLLDNIRRNVPHPNVTAHQLALLDRTGTVLLSLADDGNLGDHRVVSGDGADGRLTIEVPGSTLDAAVAPVSGPLAVKMDVQGAEPGVIAGGVRTLASASLLIMEFSPFLLARTPASVEAVLDFLGGFGTIAVTPGEHDGPLTYQPASEARAALAAFAKQAARQEYEFKDVYARR